MKSAVRKSLTEQLQPEGVPLLGHLVWWGLDRCEVKADKFKALWERHGLPSSLCVAVRNRTALLKALKELERGKLIDKILDDETQIIYMIVRRDIDQAKRDVDYDKENRVIYDKLTKELEFRVKGALSEEIKTAFARYEDMYTSREIRKIVTRTVKHYGGITVRSSGGVYFLAAHHSEPSCTALPAILKELAAGDFTVFGIADHERYRESLLEAVRRELTEDFRREKLTVKKMLEKAETGHARPKSLESRLVKLDELKKKSTQFVEYGFQPDEFVGRISKLENKINRQLGEMGG